MNISDLLATAGVAAAIIGVPAAWLTWRGFTREKNVESFIEIREHARRNQARMTELALLASPPDFRSDPIPMLTRPGWIPSLPLDDVKLEWRETAGGMDGLAASRRRAVQMMPENPLGGHYSSYSEALAKLSGMGHLYNGNVYRPLDITIDQQGLKIAFTGGKYFDHLDTSEVLAYEAAMLTRDGVCGTLEGPYRKWLGNPFDLLRRGTSLGVITLTVRRLGSSSSFYMHQRDGDHVVVGSEVAHVVPAGEFTPADVSLESMERDFDLWHTIMREYAEEFLDVPEAYGRGGRPLDYEKDQPFKRLNAARRSGALKLHILGIGLDPLTWKPEILAVCIIEAHAFDKMFDHMVERTSEGIILSGSHGKGLPFNSETVDRYASNRNTRSAARACLQLAWRHRTYLGISH